MWSLAFQQPYHNMWSFFSIKSVTTNLKLKKKCNVRKRCCRNFMATTSPNLLTELEKLPINHKLPRLMVPEKPQ